MSFSRSFIVTASLLSATSFVMASGNDLPSKATYSVIDVENGGHLSGHVFLSGSPPASETFRVGRDVKNVCGAKKERRTVLANSGHLQGVIVSLTGIHEGKEPSLEPSINIQQCELVPRIQGMMVDQQITLKNLDDMPHRVRGNSASQALFDFFQPTQGATNRKFMGELGPVEIEGDPDMPWASAWVQVLSHPYFFVSDEQGRFELEDIPPGHYELLAWHESLGTRSTQVTVVEGKTLNVSITFKSGPETSP